MKMLLMFFASILVILFCVSNIESRSISSISTISSMPVYYPDGMIGNRSPYIIWYDKYNERDTINNVKYRITLKPEKGPEMKPILIMPDLYDKYYYYFKFPFSLEPDKYTYLIERLVDFKAINSKYFHYLKYPVSGEFILDPDEKTQRDDLLAERLIEYLRLEKENKLVNGYNFIFYSSASLGSFGIGLLFYRVLDFGLISRIISIIAFTSSAIGIGAAGYYGYNYMKEKNQLRKIADIGRNVSFNANASLTAICADFELSF